MKKVLVLTLSVILLLVLVGCGPSKAEILTELTEKASDNAKNNGLKDVTVNVYKTQYDYSFNLSCSNFEDFSYEDMLKLARKLTPISAADEDAFLNSIISNGNRYTFSFSSNWIYCNGDMVYWDRENSWDYKYSSNNSSRKCYYCGLSTNYYCSEHSRWECPNCHSKYSHSK